MDEIDRLLSRVKREANGWMSLPVYRRIYETASACGGGTFVEIGTAQGAAAIALALGGKEAGHPFRLHTVDDFRTGSRPSGGSVSEKSDLVRRGFESFGVTGHIDLVVGTTADLLAANPRDIRLLLIDADGRIDRDLALLYDRLAPDCQIIIDDVDERIYFHRKQGRFVFDQKHRLTNLLVDRFAAERLLLPAEVTEQTGWYMKGPTVCSPAQIERLALPCYRELVFAPFSAEEVGGRLALHALAARIARMGSPGRG